MRSVYLLLLFPRCHCLFLLIFRCLLSFPLLRDYSLFSTSSFSAAAASAFSFLHGTVRVAVYAGQSLPVPLASIPNADFTDNANCRLLISNCSLRRLCGSASRAVRRAGRRKNKKSKNFKKKIVLFDFLFYICNTKHDSYQHKVQGWRFIHDFIPKKGVWLLNGGGKIEASALLFFAMRQSEGAGLSAGASGIENHPVGSCSGGVIPFAARYRRWYKHRRYRQRCKRRIDIGAAVV